MHLNRIALTAALAIALAAPAALAGSAPAQHWTQRQWPVVIQTQPAWEGSAIQEPSVLYEKGRYRMWYTSGKGSVCAFGYAESKDGITWVKHRGPIRGYHQPDGMRACHNSIVHAGGVYYLYYSTVGSHGVDANGLLTDPYIWVATSKDGIGFGKGRIVLRPTVDAYATANTAVFSDGTRWYMLVDALQQDGAGPWRMHLETASSPLGPFTEVADSQTWLAPLSRGGTFGAPWVIHEHGLYRLWYLATPGAGVLPTDIYYSQSTNLKDWTDPQMVVTRDNSWEVDQVADPSVVEANGVTRMYFAGLWNKTNPVFDVLGGVGMATLSG